MARGAAAPRRRHRARVATATQKVFADMGLPASDVEPMADAILKVTSQKRQDDLVKLFRGACDDEGECASEAEEDSVVADIITEFFKLAPQAVTRAVRIWETVIPMILQLVQTWCERRWAEQDGE